MWVAPNIQLKCPSCCLNPDPTKDISSYGQLGGGHGSWYPRKECVTTHRPNEEVPKMDGAQDSRLILDKEEAGGLRKCRINSSFVGGRGDSLSGWSIEFGGGRPLSSPPAAMRKSRA